jgi:hypothetical protein
MSEPKIDLKPKKTPEAKSQDKREPQPVQNNVIKMFSDQCSAEGCTKKSSRAGFCDEHYLWFKEGLITIQGRKAKDFERKIERFMEKQRSKTAA